MWAIVILINIFMVLLINEVTDAEGLEFVNPMWLYGKHNVNWFGAIFLTIVFNILTFIFAIGYWFYKLCTVGRL